MCQVSLSGVGTQRQARAEETEAPTWGQADRGDGSRRQGEGWRGSTWHRLCENPGCGTVRGTVRGTWQKLSKYLVRELKQSRASLVMGVPELLSGQ